MIKKILTLSTLMFMVCNIYAQTVSVTFQVQNPDSTPVYVFGSWSNWTNWPGDLMTDANGDGIYDKTLVLPNNANYEYLYVNGVGPTKETLNPAWTCTNGNGQYTNRVLTITNTDTTVCNYWSSCGACGSTPILYVDVTFQLQNPNTTPVYVFGSWSGWSNWPGTEMVLNNTNGLYEATISVQGDSAIEYLYVSGSTPAIEVLDPAWPCTNSNAVNTNRLVNVGVNDTTLCGRFATCDPCLPTGINELNNQQFELFIAENSLKINSSNTNVLQQVDIFDALGRKVWTQKDVQTNMNWPVSLQKNQFYIVRIQSEGQQLSYKNIVK
jgi:hypothetical protein